MSHMNAAEPAAQLLYDFSTDKNFSSKFKINFKLKSKVKAI